MQDNKDKYELFLDSLVLFGKYKGKSVKYMIDKDLDYSDWFFSIYTNLINKHTLTYFNTLWEDRNFKKYGFKNNI